MTTYAAGDFSSYGGVKRTCILDEGAITVTDSTYTIGGGTTRGHTFATPLSIGMPVSLSTDTGNTWSATDGSILVEPVSNTDDLVAGIIISEPEWTVQPASTGVADTLAKRLTAKYYRVATVWFPGFVAITQATLVCANATAVTPGTVSILDVDVSGSTAGKGLVLNDIASANGCANLISLHYQAQSASATTPIMVAFLGGCLTAAT
jgi:hypothetical protein